METIEITISLIKIRTGIIIIIIGKPKDHTTVIGNPIMTGNMKKSLSIEEFVIMMNKTIVL